jgi:hypothetical protein
MTATIGAPNAAPFSQAPRVLSNARRGPRVSQRPPAGRRRTHGQRILRRDRIDRGQRLFTDEGGSPEPRRPAGQHLEEETPERPQIAGLIAGLPSARVHRARPKSSVCRAFGVTTMESFQVAVGSPRRARRRARGHLCGDVDRAPGIERWPAMTRPSESPERTHTRETRGRCRRRPVGPRCSDATAPVAVRASAIRASRFAMSI